MMRMMPAWIDDNMDGAQNATEWYEMDETDGGDTVYTDGKTYEYITTLPDVGDYNYSFKAKDSNGALSTGSPTGLFQGPTVEAPPNLPPIVSFLGMGGAYNDTGVSPATGDLETDFVYKVLYTDAEGDLPGTDWPKVYIDAEGDGDYTGTAGYLYVSLGDGQINLLSTVGSWEGPCNVEEAEAVNGGSFLVPEPVTLSILALGSLALLRRKRSI